MQQSGDDQGTGGLRGADVSAPSLGSRPSGAEGGVQRTRDGVRAEGAPPGDAIPADEREALRTRRRLARVVDHAATPTVGLALSGGGIRSATFCLGLMRGMARRGLLSRFDYLSTVSGGGYTGAMFGRLVGRVGIAEAERILAASDSRPLAWLRRYGRYLAPRGAKDYGMGLATYLRAMVAVHLEFAFLALVIGLVAVLPHALHRHVGLFEITAWSGWPSAWWPLAAGLWFATAPGLLGVYWMLRDPPTTSAAASAASAFDPGKPSEGRRPRFRLWDLLVVLAAAGVGGTLLVRWAMAAVEPVSEAWVGLPGPGWAPLLGLVLASLGVFGVAMATALQLARREEAPRATVARLRRRMTGGLRAANVAFAVLLLLGLLDWASWTLLDLLGGAPGRLYGGLGLGGLVLLLLRALLEPAQKWLGSLTGGGGGLPMLAGVLGYALAFLLLVLWTTLMQWCVFSPSLSAGLASGLSPALAPALGAQTAGAVAEGAQRAGALPDLLGWIGWIGEDALWRWAACAAVLALWGLGTGTNAESANTTSLHNMYAARLVRAYLGAVNAHRVGDGGTAGLSASAEGTSPETLSNVTEVHPDDDVPLDRYDPSTNGGPIHLVNVCLNQTRGHRSGLYNADRKGVPLVVGAHGLRVGRTRVPVDGSGRLGTLGRWVAISGAAASPGAGAYTTPGWASLLFLAGARLGFWLDMHGAVRAVDPHAQAPRRFSAEWWRDHWQATKMGRLASEFRAVYGGPLARNWYLSDGGHFDNTGVHSLLERELDLIVLADCGADPRYELADLENLVRKARIDFGADIEFYTGDDANALHRRLCADGDDDQAADAGTGDAADDVARSIAFLSPEALADNTTARGLLLARILYRADREGRRKEGRLVVVKPNLHAALDMDLLAYARRNPRFPQQPTGDQFFDEAQWESYHRLGEDIGAQLRRDWLLPLAGRARLSDPPRIRASRLQKEAAAAGGAFWRLDARRAAVGALSLGALIAVVAPTWQVIDHVRGERERQRKDLMTLVRDAERVHGGLAGTEDAARIDADGPYVVSRLKALSTRFPRDSIEGGSLWRLLDRIERVCGQPRGTLSDARWDERTEICGQLKPPQSAQTRLRREYWDRREHDDAQDAIRAAHAAQAIIERTGAPSAVLAAREVRRQSQELRVRNAIDAVGPTQGAADVMQAAGTADASVADGHDPLRAHDASPDTSPDASPETSPDTSPDTSASPELLPTPPASPRPGSVDAVRAACTDGDGPTQRLYIHVFDADGSAAMLALPWERSGLFAGTPEIENVAVTAAARGERPPRAHVQPTLLLHDPAHSVDCSEALGLWLARPTDAGAPASAIRIRPLPKGYRGQPGVIELWWPPVDVSAAAQDRATVID